MIDQTDFEQLAHQYPVLAQFPVDLHQALCTAGHRTRLPAGVVMFDVGFRCASLTLLYAGALRVSKPGPDREILLYHVRPGEFCILTVACLMSDARYSVRGVVEEELHGASIPAQLFKKLLQESADFPVSLLKSYARALPKLVDLIECVTFMQLDRRLAALLLMKGDRIKTTHQNLADELGSVREVVSRILKEFEGDRILRLERGCIHILDRPALEKIASDKGD